VLRACLSNDRVWRRRPNREEAVQNERLDSFRVTDDLWVAVSLPFIRRKAEALASGGLRSPASLRLRRPVRQAW